MNKKHHIEPDRAAELFSPGSENKLKRARIKAGFSQAELAEKSGVPKRAIFGYEQHERVVDRAKLETICDLCIALNCSISDLLESKEVMEKYLKVNK